MRKRLTLWFAPYRRMDFVSLNEAGLDIAHSGVQHRGAFAACRLQHGKPGVPVTIC